MINYNLSDEAPNPPLRQAAVTSSNYFGQKFQFPDDVFLFGKHKGKDIGWVIDNDRIYFNWLMSKGLYVTHLVSDYAKGINVLRDEIITTINYKFDILSVFRQKYYLLEKEKFVRKKDKKRIVSKGKLAEFTIDIDFSISKEKRSKTMDYTHFHCDIETVEYEVETKTYNEPQFSNFVSDKLRSLGL